MTHAEIWREALRRFAHTACTGVVLAGCSIQHLRSVPADQALPVARTVQAHGDMDCTAKAGRTECPWIIDTPEQLRMGVVQVASDNGGPAQIVHVGTDKDRRDCRDLIALSAVDAALTLGCAGIQEVGLLRTILGAHPSALGLLAVKGAVLAYQCHELRQFDDGDSAAVVKWTKAIGVGVVALNIGACL